MNVEAIVSGPLKDHKDFFLCKGKYQGEDWQGIIQKKGENACLVVMKKFESKSGKQKIISYSGNILSEMPSTKAGTKIEFAGVQAVLREQRPEDSNADLARRLDEQEEVIKRQAEALEKSNALMEKMLDAKPSAK